MTDSANKQLTDDSEVIPNDVETKNLCTCCLTKESNQSAQEESLIFRIIKKLLIKLFAINITQALSVDQQF